MRKKKQPEPDNKEQSARFLETAKRVLADDGKEKFDKACATILKKKPSR